jgi:hypothetical protein
VQRFHIGADTLFEFDRATLTGEAEKKLAELGLISEVSTSESVQACSF